MFQDKPAFENEVEPQIYDQEAENTLLATIIVEPDRLSDIAETDLNPGDFYFSANSLIFRAMKILEAKQTPIDNITLADQLENDGNLIDAGGPGYIAQLIGSANGFNALEYARIIKDKSRKRAALQLASTVAKLAGSKNFDQDLDGAIELLENLKPRGNPENHLNFSTWSDLDAVIGPICWDWQNWLAKGFLNILVGMTGEGKSILSLRICASYLAGWCWPDGKLFTGETSKVIWCEAEAAQALNLERAKKWGLPIENILNPLGDPLADFRLANLDHRNQLACMAMQQDVSFIVVDSLSGADPTAERSTEDTTNIKWLASLARDIDKPIQLTHHLRKRNIFDVNGVVSLDRVRGISTILQYSRLIWALDTPDQTNLENKRLSVIKSNLGKKPEPIGVTIDDAGIVFGTAPQAPHVETVTSKASDLLLAILQKAPILATQIETEMNNAGISWAAARRAKEKLRIVSIKQGDGRWYWSLPPNDEGNDDWTNH
jgi:hypothetical protein